MTESITSIVYDNTEYNLGTKVETIQVTLTSAGWSGNAQTVTATGVTATNTVICSPVPSSMSDYTAGGVYCSTQATDSLTFECDTEPTNDIDVNVVIIYVDAGTPTPPTPGWQPGVNTVGYRPLTTTTQGTDQSGNGYDLSGTYRTFGTYAGVDCVEVSGGGNSDPRLYNSSIPISTTETCLAWFYCTDTSNSGKGVMSLGNDWEHNTIGGGVAYTTNTPWLTDWFTHDEYGTGSYTNSRHLMAITYDGTTAILYIDGVENVRYNFTRTSGVGIAFSHKASYVSDRFSERFTGYLSEAIYENKARTAQEVADYYNQTKANYGIS